MTVARYKGDKAMADMLCGRIVRHRGRCERCGLEGVRFDWAHIVRRTPSATRCLEDNAWCLCGSCHWLVDNWAHEKMALVSRTIGDDRYYELVRLANTKLTMSRKLFWQAERARLEARCRELGLSPKRNPEWAA